MPLRSERTPADRALVAILAGAHLALFLVLPVVQITDHKYLLMASDSLLRRGTLRLDGLSLTGAPLVAGAEARSPDYRIEVVGGHHYHSFPVGTAVLSAPLVAAARLLGTVTADADGSYDPRGERRLNRLGAAAIAAFLAVPFFALARSFVPARLSAALTSAVILGTPLTSTVSRGLWSHDFGVLLVALALAHAIAAEVGEARLRPLWLGSLLAWAYLCRPTFALAAVACLGRLAWSRRTRGAAAWTAIVGVLWLVPFTLWAHASRGSWLPSYYAPSRLAVGGFVTGLSGNLVSPSRGVLVFVPWLPWLGWAAWRRRERLAAPGWVITAAIVTIAQLVVVASFPKWYGGHSYGARMMTDVVPWWFAALAVVAGTFVDPKARRAAGTGRWLVATGVVLGAIAIALNGIGAASEASWRWNARDGGIDASVERLWSWREAQFLAPLQDEPRPAP